MSSRLKRSRPPEKRKRSSNRIPGHACQGTAKSRKAATIPCRTRRRRMSLRRKSRIFPKALTAIWQQVLGLPRVGIDDNFFESGGTSLLATVLISRINEMLRRENQDELSIASIFEHPTLRAMTSLVLGKAGNYAREQHSNPSDRLSEGIYRFDSLVGNRHHRHDRPFPRSEQRRRVLDEPGQRRRVDHLLRSRAARRLRARDRQPVRELRRRATDTERRGQVRCRLLRDLSERGRAHGSAAPRVPRMRMGGAGACRLRSCPHNPIGRRLRRLQHEHLLHAQPRHGARVS